MKKLLFTCALLINAILVFAVDKQTTARATTDNVKMYRQAGTSSDVVIALKSTDDIVVIRKHNANWTLVTFNDKVGYIVSSELTSYKNKRHLSQEKALP